MAVPFLWSAIIFFVYSIPGGDIVYTDWWSFFRFDKFVHISIFALWVVMLIVAFKKQTANRPLRNNARTIALLLALSYGGTLEYMQSKVFTGRTTDALDFVANVAGAFAGLLLFRLIYGKYSTY